MTPGTQAAFFEMAVRIGTETGDGAAAAVGAVIERTPKAAGLLEKQVVADFLGKGGTVPSKGTADFLKGSRIIKHEFDSNAFS